jgi:DNA-binding NarL/FixJ family response regulator
MTGMGGHPAIRVVIVDDHELVRAGIAGLLKSTPDIVVAGEAANGEEAVAVVAATEPDLVLMDLSMPGVGGTEAIRRIHAAQPGVRVVVLSSYVDSTDVLDALDAGAIGYLLKDLRPDDLLRDIRAAAADGSPMAPLAAREVVAAWRAARAPGELTDRELDVLLILADGASNKLIGQRLNIAEKTVKAHVTHIFQALGVSDRTQAALWVERHGLSPTQERRREQLRARPLGQGHWS